MEDRVELIDQPRVKVVALQLGLRAVNHSDRALPRLRRQPLEVRTATAQIEPKSRNAQPVEAVFVAVGTGGRYELALLGGVPIRSGRDAAAVGREADSEGGVAVAAARQRADVRLAPQRHRSGLRVADV